MKVASTPEKALGKRAAIEAAARAGTLPTAPDFSAATHERFRNAVSGGVLGDQRIEVAIGIARLAGFGRDDEPLSLRPPGQHGGPVERCEFGDLQEHPAQRDE